MISNSDIRFSEEQEHMTGATRYHATLMLRSSVNVSENYMRALGSSQSQMEFRRRMVREIRHTIYGEVAELLRHAARCIVQDSARSGRPELSRDLSDRCLRMAESILTGEDNALPSARRDASTSSWVGSIVTLLAPDGMALNGLVTDISYNSDSYQSDRAMVRYNPRTILTLELREDLDSNIYSQRPSFDYQDMMLDSMREASDGVITPPESITPQPMSRQPRILTDL